MTRETGLRAVREPDHNLLYNSINRHWQGYCSTATFSITAPCSINTAEHYTVNAYINQTSTTADAIAITVNDVVLDLNGYSVTTPTSGSGRSIDACTANPCATNVIIRNGHVTTSGFQDMLLGDTAHVEQTQPISAFSEGIFVSTAGTNSDGNNSVIYQSVIASNGSDGVDLGSDSLIMQNTLSVNGGNGATVGSGGLVEGNTAADNASGDGLSLSANTGFARNVMGSDSACTNSSGVSLGGGNTNLCSGTEM